MEELALGKNWAELNDRFFKTLAFGTGGLRGRTIGKIVTKDEESYRYLVESIRRFPRPAAFKAMVAEAGFVRASAEPMLGGLVTIHSGWKI